MARAKRIKYRKYPYTVTIRMTVDKIGRSMYSPEGSLKIHIRRNHRIVATFYCKTEQERQSFLKHAHEDVQKIMQTNPSLHLTDYTNYTKFN